MRRFNTALMRAVLVSSLVSPSSLCAQEGAEVKITVDDPRPLNRAIQELQGRLGWTVTYEESPWLCPADAVDVTAIVRKDGDMTRRVLAPRGGHFSFAAVLPGGDEVEARQALLEKLLQGHHSTGNPGVFRLDHTNDVFHVVIAASRNPRGTIEARKALLDTLVTLPSEDRSAIALVEAVLAEVTRATGVKVGVGIFPMNLFTQLRVPGGAANESARNVLTRLVEAAKGRVSWQLLCGAGADAGCHLSFTTLTSARSDGLR